MYLFRAINEYEEKFFNKNGELPSNFYLHKDDEKSKDKWITKRDEVKKYGFSLVLDRVFGHINGKGLDTSMWVSTSKDFNYVCKKYAIIQTGGYNTQNNRKRIVVVSDAKEMDLRKARNADFIGLNEFNGQYVDLTNDRLIKYYDEDLINPYESNEHADVSISTLSKFTYENGKLVYDKRGINGFNGYVNKASEVLIFWGIYNKNIKYVLDPLMQDIIFAYTYNKNIDFVNNNIDSIYDKYKDYQINNLTNEELNIFNYLYKPNSNNQYNSLITLIEETALYSRDIEQDYRVLKEVKRDILRKITGLDKVILIDDFIYVTNDIISEKRYKTKEQQNPIVYKVRDNDLYKKNIKIKTLK